MDYYNALLSIIIVIVIIIIIYTTFADYQVERFFPITNEPVTKEGELNIDVDDLEFNESGNVSLSRDIDLLQQRKIGMKFDQSDYSDHPQTIDNSDVVDQVVSRGDTIFQPSHGIGVSATTTAGMGKFTLAGPSGLPFFDDQTVYDSPTNGQFSIDEKMSIAQQHRGSIAQKAIEGYVRSTKNLYKKYFLNELDENSNREWWDDSASEGLETDFGPDIDIY